MSDIHTDASERNSFTISTNSGRITLPWSRLDELEMIVANLQGLKLKRMDDGDKTVQRRMGFAKPSELPKMPLPAIPQTDFYY